MKSPSGKNPVTWVRRLLTGEWFLRAWLCTQKSPSPKPRPDPSKVRQILIVKVDGLGDLVLATPFFEKVHAVFPQAKIHLVIDRKWSALLEDCPFVELHPIDLPRLRVGKLWRTYRRLRQHARRLRPCSFDLTFILRADVDYNWTHLLLPMVSSAYNVGFGKIYPWKRSAPSFEKLLNDFFAEDAPTLHESQINFLLLRDFGVAMPALPPAAHLWPRPGQSNAADDKAYFVVGVGASTPEKIFPPERMGPVIEALRERTQSLPIIVGGGGDPLPTLSGSFRDLRGQTPLPELIRLLRGARFYIGMESGPLHCAAACDLPVIGISPYPRGISALEPGSPQRFGPIAARALILQPPGNKNHHASFAELTVDHVVQESLKFLDQAGIA